jgi:hypothetical protein
MVIEPHADGYGANGVRSIEANLARLGFSEDRKPSTATCAPSSAPKSLRQC